MNFSKEPGEKIILRATTKFSGQLGALIFTNLRLVWIQTGHSEPSLHFHLSEIKNQFVSTPQSNKALLRLGVKDSVQDKIQDFLFEFTHTTNARSDLNSFRDKIAQLANLSNPAPAAAKDAAATGSDADPKSTNSSPTLASKQQLLKQQQQQKLAAEEKAKQNPFLSSLKQPSISETEIKQRVTLLASNKDLKHLFDSLVGRGVISESDFWESRKVLLKNDTVKSEKQSTGMPSNILSDVRPTSEDGNQVKYRLTPTIIHQIFIQYPSVEKAYKANVPHKISEQDFWKKYVQSKYFYRDRNINAPPAQDDLFSKYDTDELNSIKILKRKLLDINPLVDISSEGDDDKLTSGYGVLIDQTQNPEKLEKALPLLRRFNRHSALVLGSKDLLSSNLTETPSKKLKIGEDEDEASIAEKEKILEHNKHLIQKHAIIQDLADDKTLDIPTLKILDQKRYFEGNSSAILSTSERVELREEFQEANTLWVPDFYSIFFNDNNNEDEKQQSILKEIQSVSSVVSNQNTTTDEYVLNESTFKTEFFNKFRTSNELLRHFWATTFTPGRGVPPTPQRMEKNRKLVEVIGDMYDKLQEKQNELRDAGKKNQGILFTSILSTLNKAIEKAQSISNPPNQNTIK
ncbi:hypothetical protein CYY_000968 [Polysphondylium violaceum]|uniref:BSD domain-containing protein n=1 Tax=Polysphondylium violaceum TaxID=133409 RepID=A0A8J4Q0U4_9MYCE|nr:hypothetical protein CYY_000968 [Polysphondylium violaceum]